MFHTSLIWMWHYVRNTCHVYDYESVIISVTITALSPMTKVSRRWRVSLHLKNSSDFLLLRLARLGSRGASTKEIFERFIFSWNRRCRFRDISRNFTFTINIRIMSIDTREYSQRDAIRYRFSNDSKACRKHFQLATDLGLTIW